MRRLGAMHGLEPERLDFSDVHLVYVVKPNPLEPRLWGWERSSSQRPIFEATGSLNWAGSCSVLHIKQTQKVDLA